MLSSTRKLAVVIFAIFVVFSTPMNCDVVPPDSGVKCTPCTEQNPPPPPLALPPPPPALPPPPPPTKPPPSPSYPYTPNCPPPPSSSSSSSGHYPPSPPSPYYYLTGPPGNLYPYDQYYSVSCRNWVPGFLVTVGFGILGLLPYWRI